MAANQEGENNGGASTAATMETRQGEEASAAMRLLLVQHDPESGPGTLERPLMADGADLEFWLPFRGEDAPPLVGFAGVLAFGGTANPDEDQEQPWLSEVREYVAEVAERGNPFRCPPRLPGAPRGGTRPEPPPNCGS